ncbi:MAG: choice-of-anchor Q domain-containing protein [Solirubrobacteraceae bacterium]
MVTVPAGSRVAITDLSIAGGNAVQGGGVNNAGDLTLLRDTVAFNTASDPPSGDTLATGDGGGIFSTGSLTVQDSTVASNRATGSGGGIAAFDGTLNAARDAIVNNTIGPALGGGADDSSCPVELPGVAPQLQPLANNGGISQTMAIGASSPAYDANPLCDATDQRGVSRRQLGATQCDIGAYQLSALHVTNGNGTVTTDRAGAHGNVAPASRLTLNAGAARPYGLNFDTDGNLVVADSAASRVDTFAAAATGSTAPLRVLSGTPPALSSPVGLDLDLSGDIFVANRASNSLSEYAPGASGGTLPLATIAGADTGLSTPFFLSELPPPPAPRVDVTTGRRQSRKRIKRGGITLALTASGTRAFRSQPIILTATARANRHTIAAVRATPLRPGHAKLLLIPGRHAAHVLRSARVHEVTVVITIRGGAGKQVRRLTIRLTR